MARQRARVRQRAALLGSRDAELLHLPVQHRTLHPQAGRGPLRPAHHPAGLAEGTEDVLPLGVGQRDRLGSWQGLRRPRALTPGLRGRRLQVA